MTPSAPSRRQSVKSACDATREWVAVGLGTAAGVGFICPCLCGSGPMGSSVLLLFLCLTLLGRLTVLDRLVQLSRVVKPGGRPGSR
jgi:hypothetical protein